MYECIFMSRDKLNNQYWMNLRLCFPNEFQMCINALFFALYEGHFTGLIVNTSFLFNSLYKVDSLEYFPPTLSTI